MSAIPKRSVRARFLVHDLAALGRRLGEDQFERATDAACEQVACPRAAACVADNQRARAFPLPLRIRIGGTSTRVNSGPAGIEPATLGVKVRPENAQPAASN